MGDADTAQLDRGANLALVGGEMMQFGRAVPLGGGRWRLSALWRARRGVTGAVTAGDPFVLIEADAVRFVDLPLASLGSEVRVMASGVGDAEPVVAGATVTGASVLPPAPVAVRVVEGGAAVVWTRRSRAGWRWLDGVDAPLGEEGEAYRVSVTSGGGTRELVPAEPRVTLNAAERAGATVTVRQRGTYGESPTATIRVGEGR